MWSVIQRCFLETKVSFFRKYNCELRFVNPTASLRPFWFSYGVTASVDPQSGMTVNLVLVDQWAGDFLAFARGKAWSNFADFFQAAFFELEKKAQTFAAGVVRLELTDDEEVPWIFYPQTGQIFWQQEVALNIGEEAFWLRLKADHRTALNHISVFQHERWKNMAELAKHFNLLEEAWLISHRTGAELRLK